MKNKVKYVIHEKSGKKEPDICGEVIELFNEHSHVNNAMSIATVFIDPGKESIAHFHKKMEEIYYIINGEGKIFINGDETNLEAGHAIYLPVGAVHKIKNTGKSILKFVSIDSPIFDENDIYTVV
jgi:mannose-6-phosphate isomerase-like protein (cupin superfamily)